MTSGNNRNTCPMLARLSTWGNFEFMSIEGPTDTMSTGEHPCIPTPICYDLSDVAPDHTSLRWIAAAVQRTSEGAQVSRSLSKTGTYGSHAIGLSRVFAVSESIPNGERASSPISIETAEPIVRWRSHSDRQRSSTPTHTS